MCAGSLIGPDGVVLNDSMLPANFTAVANSVNLTYVPTRDILLQPLLCFGKDSFTVRARNLNTDGLVHDSAVTTLYLAIACDAIVCGPGQAKAVSTAGVSLCLACAKGTYNLHSNSTCKPCPVGAICQGDAELATATGYWFSTEDEAFYKCNPGRCCASVHDCGRFITNVFADTDLIC